MRRETALSPPQRESDDVAARADLRLVGIGQMDHNAQVLVDGFVTRQELLDMMRRGAAGEITGWVFDREGHIIEGGTN